MNNSEIMEIRKDFPYLDVVKNNEKIIYFDNAATTQRPRKVIEALANYYSYANANPHRSAHYFSMESTKVYEESKECVRRFIGAKKVEEIIFTRNATESINLVAYSYARKVLKAGDEILISILEHHSNICTWQMVCKETGAKLKYVYLDEDKQINMQELEAKLTDKVKIVAITGASNTVATLPDIKTITDMAHKKGAVVLIDGAQFAAHNKIDVVDLDCDFYVMSGHKLLAPLGIGVLYAKYKLLDEMEPFLYGGDMIEYVTEQETTYAKPSFKFEAGTQNVGGALGLKTAIEYIESIGFDKIAEYEKKLMDYAYEKMIEIPYLDIYTTKNKYRSPIILYNYKEVHPHDVATIMDSYNIAIRSGHHCAAPLHSYLNINSSCRVSFAFYNTFSEVDKFIESIPKVQEVFGLGY